MKIINLGFFIGLCLGFSAFGAELSMGALTRPAPLSLPTSMLPNQAPSAFETMTFQERMQNESRCNALQTAIKNKENIKDVQPYLDTVCFKYNPHPLKEIVLTAIKTCHIDALVALCMKAKSESCDNQIWQPDLGTLAYGDLTIEETNLLNPAEVNPRHFQYLPCIVAARLIYTDGNEKPSNTLCNEFADYTKHKFLIHTKNSRFQYLNYDEIRDFCAANSDFCKQAIQRHLPAHGVQNLVCAYLFTLSAENDLDDAPLSLVGPMDTTKDKASSSNNSGRNRNLGESMEELDLGESNIGLNSGVWETNRGTKRKAEDGTGSSTAIASKKAKTTSGSSSSNSDDATPMNSSAPAAASMDCSKQ